MTESTYIVAGMTCGHCASAVTGELVKLPSVDDVAIDLDTKKVTVFSSGPLDIEQVRVAVDEAGYELS
jgi:copper chaperone CopZ